MSANEIQKKAGTKWTEERRSTHGENMKEAWKIRKTHKNDFICLRPYEITPYINLICCYSLTFLLSNNAFLSYFSSSLPYTLFSFTSSENSLSFVSRRHVFVQHSLSLGSSCTLVNVVANLLYQFTTPITRPKNMTLIFSYRI